MIRISVVSKDQIENVSAAAVQAVLREAGLGAERVRVTRISSKQYEQAIRE